jgi:hypothetical protein
MLWCGYQDCLRLSGFNILAFVSICQHIWDAWLQQQESTWNAEVDLPAQIPVYVQDQGIQQASRYWYRKIRSDPNGDSRQRFVSIIGEMFRRLLRDDSKMSYPGHNGFSVSLDDLERAPDVANFLREAASYGVLFDRVHTDRSRGGGKRVKWYLNPIYSPYFQIYVQHVKEPKYVRVDDVREWMIEAGIIPKPASLRSHPLLQDTLF